MKKYLRILTSSKLGLYLNPIFIFLFISFNAYSQNTGDTESLFPVKDTIQIAVEPQKFVTEKGEVEGFSVDVIKEVAKAAGLKVKIKIGIWNQMKKELEEGEIDALPFVGKTPEREKLFDFSIPYLSLEGAVFVRKGTKEISSVEDLKDKEIVVLKGDNSEEFVRREKISDKIFTTYTIEEAFKELASGKYDALVTQRATGVELLREMGIKSVVPLDFQTPLFRQDFCIAVKKGNRALLNRLNDGLSIIIANDTYQKIRTKWLGPVYKEKLSIEDIIKMSLLIMVPLIIIMSLFMIFVLKKEVKRKTYTLNQEIESHKITLVKLKNQQKQLIESEQQIRLLLNSTVEGIYGIDNNGLCTFINTSALQMLGFTENEVIGKNMHFLIHHSSADGSELSLDECQIHQAPKHKRGITSDKDVFWRKNNSSFSVEFFSYPIIQGETIIGTVVTFRDITERKKTEHELNQLKDDLEKQVTERTTELENKVYKLNRSQKAMLYMVEDLNKITAELKTERKKLEISNNELDAFTYSVSHDLRAPLRAINGFSGFLNEDYKDKLDNEGKRYLNVIKQNASRMDTLISDMLYLSRVSRSEMRISRVNMMAVAKSMFMEIASAAEKKDFDLVITRDRLEVRCDLGLMKQVWQNLISNAIKYSAKSEIKKIEIGANNSESGISFYVKDWGAGFDPKYSHKLFGVFQRLHKENEFEGTGVGLAIVQRIIQRHDGQVWAESELNKGATFWFSLPH